MAEHTEIEEAEHLVEEPPPEEPPAPSRQVAKRRRLSSPPAQRAPPQRAIGMRPQASSSSTLAHLDERIPVKKSTLKNAVDALRRAHTAVKHSQRLCTAAAQGFSDEADILGESKAALEALL